VDNLSAEIFMTENSHFERRYMLLAARIAGDFGATIAVPVVALSVIGKRLDLRYGTWPGLTILGFVLAAVVTFLIIKRKTKKYADEYAALIVEDRASRAARKK
jgi:hypothetical protein